MLLFMKNKLGCNLEDELKELIKSNKVIPFVGAGVSLSVTSKIEKNKIFLTWKELLLKLSDYLEKYDKNDETELIRLSLKVKKNDYLQIAGDIKRFFPSDQLFYNSLKEILDKQSEEIEESSLSFAKSIWNLNQKLIITTNYDKVLHWASDSPKDTNRWDIQSVHEQAGSLGSEVKNQTVWHLHGHIDNVKNIILTEDSYKELYNDEKNSKFKVAYNTLRHYLMSKPFLFIGYSLDDEYFVNELIDICNIFDSQSILHYILIEKNRSLPKELEKKIIPIYYEEKGEKLIEKLKSLSCQNNNSENNKYIEKDVKNTVIDEFYPKSLPFCIHNLPTEEYNFDGGFVGRKDEVLKLQNLIYSNEDRIITITGAGGLGKTSIALKCAYTFLNDLNNPFIIIIWFSAKEDKLTSENGIVQISSQITDYSLLLKDILKLLDENTYTTFEKNNISNEIFKDSIYKIFLQKRSLLIIDNLETINNKDIIDFIKDIPRPSQVLITSRKGLGEVERRHPLLDFPLEDSVELFKIISKERNRLDLLKLSDSLIKEKVKKVRSYPLLIKWSIGKICLGMDIDKAFNEIYSGESEISQFVFNDIFNLISAKSRKCLFSMIIFGEKPISKYLMQHLSSLNSDEMEDSIKELIITSFIFSEVVEVENELTSTYYSMLSLTRGFIKHKLDSKDLLKNELISKYRELSLQIEKSQKSKDSFEQSLLEFGIKTEEDKIAFNYVKTAKNYLSAGNQSEAKNSFDKALEIAPELSYVLSEYGKFEASMGHNYEAEKYFLKACHIDDKNFHTHFAYGVFLRKINNIENAIIHLKKAKRLNPRYLPIYNELGRSLSFNGQYEEANDNFILSLDQKDEFINFKHLNISLYYKSDNYKRWAKELFLRKDYEKGKEKLFRSLDIIEKANENYKFDIKNQNLEKKISQDIGKIMLTLNEYEIGKKHLLKSTERIKSNSISCKEDSDFIFDSFITLISYIINEKIDEPNLKNFIEKAELYSLNQRSKNKLESLTDRISKKNIKEGVIKFFNVKKEFGVIDSFCGKSYTFRLDNLMTSLPEEDLYQLESKRVTFKEKANNYDKNFAKTIHII